MSGRAQALLFVLALMLPCYTGGQAPDVPRPAQRGAQSAIGFKTEPSMTEELVRTGAVLALLAAGFVSSAYGYRHLQRQRSASSARRLKVVETLALAPKTRLFLVELDQHTILLGQHGATLSVLADHTPLKDGGAPPAASESR